MADRAVTDPVIAEVAWEVCNQVGGIYTVLRTKACQVVERYHSRYLVVGPYVSGNAAVDFEESVPPEPIALALRAELEQQRCYWGRWLVPGEPQALLLRLDGHEQDLGEYKERLWREFQISTLPPDTLVDESIIFSFLVADALSKIGSHQDSPMIVHAHEWLSGAALLLVKKRLGSQVRTVFTTHATLVGRYEAGNNPHFYRDLETVNADARARHYNIASRHALEKASAQGADVFTTVSEVTGREAELFLGRAPDAILPNGLNAHRFTALHEFQNLHNIYKQQIHEFVTSHFFPSYSFDLDNTLYFFTSGRLEYRNKGMDLFINALADLNDRLSRLSRPPTVVAFIISRAETTNIKPEPLKGRLMYHELHALIDQLKQQIGEQLLEAVTRKIPFNDVSLLSTDAQTRLKRAAHAFTREALPEIVTHNLAREELDPVIEHLRRKDLLNQADHPVKVVYHPDFITATSPLFGMDYDNFVRGCHLGVFPSYYEPWGYTPLESIALGIPTVTTDLTGFGSFVRKTIPNAWERGIFVLNRSTKDDRESTGDLATYLFRFCQLSRRERIDLRNRAEQLTELFDWSQLGAHYFRIYDAAFALRGRSGGATNPR